MQKLICSAAMVATMVAVAGCDTTSAIAGYTPSTPNVLAFQSALKPTGTTVRVGEFVSGPGVDKPTCRMAGVLDVSPGKSVDQYVKDAMQTDLFTAQVYDVNSANIVNGTLDIVKVNTFGDASWTLGLKVTSSQDPVGYHVETVRAFKSSFSAIAACQNASNAFAPTVQGLIGQVVNNAGFSKLVGTIPGATRAK